MRIALLVIFPILIIFLILLVPLLILFGFFDTGVNRQFVSVPLEVGQPMEFECALLDGTKINLENFEGQVVLIDFWATWCKPCLAEFPAMREAYEKYHESGFEIIGYSIDEQLEDLKDFQKRHQLPWLVGSAELSKQHQLTNYTEQYGIEMIPRMVLIGRDGKIIHDNVYAEDLQLELVILFPVDAPAVKSQQEQESITDNKQ